MFRLRPARAAHRAIVEVEHAAADHGVGARERELRLVRLALGELERGAQRGARPGRGLLVGEQEELELARGERLELEGAVRDAEEELGASVDRPQARRRAALVGEEHAALEPGRGRHEAQLGPVAALLVLAPGVGLEALADVALRAGRDQAPHGAGIAGGRFRLDAHELVAPLRVGPGHGRRALVREPTLLGPDLRAGRARRRTSSGAESDLDAPGR
jgi:hypothetical protein